MMRKGLSFGSPPGVLFSSGVTWSEVRKTSVHALRDFGYGHHVFEGIIDEETENLINYIENNCLNKPVEDENFFNVAVLAALWRIISGESLKIGDPKLQLLTQAVANLTHASGDSLIAMSFESLPLYKLLNKIGYTDQQENFDLLLDYTSSVVQKIKSSTIDSENYTNFTEEIISKIQHTDDPNHPFYGKTGELNLVNLLFDLFLAGADTSATTFEWMMIYLIKNPEAQINARKELESTIGLSERANYDDRHLTPYNEAVIHEVHRMASIVPMSIFHYVTQDMQVESFKVPSGTILIPMIIEVMKSPKHFPNPEEFKPERYLVEESENVLKFVPNKHVVPFGIGNRKCLGEILARMTLYKFMTAIIQKYDIVSGQSEPITDEALPGYIRNPIPYKFKFVPRM